MAEMEVDNASWSGWIAYRSQSAGKNGLPVQSGEMEPNYRRKLACNYTRW